MAGPAWFFASTPVRVKMPAPMTTETPKTVRSHQVRSLRSRVSGSSVSAIDCSTDLVRRLLVARAADSCVINVLVSSSPVRECTHYFP